jgi:uncharacterized protein (TIGR02231 family)
MKTPFVSRSVPCFAAFAAFVAALPLVLPVSVYAQAPATGVAESKAAVPLESRLRAATVYPDRAVVGRAAKARVVGGTNEMIFEGLPATLVDESVQVSARGTVAASLLDIVTRTVFVSAEPDARVKALEDRIAGLRREERALNDSGAVLDTQRALVGQIEKAFTTPVAGAPGATAPVRPTLDDYTQLLAFSASQRGRVDEAARGLTLEREALAEKIAAAENQLNELRGKQPGRRATKVVTVRIAAPAAGDLDLSLSYAVPGASWSPAYDARLRSAERKVQLEAFGLVRNATGEDWTAVELTLSTARPGLGGAAPEISPWYVDLVRPVVMNKFARGSMAIDRTLGSTSAVAGEFDNKAWNLAPGSAQLHALEAEDRPRRPDPSATVIGAASAEVESAATSANFRIAAPTTVPSDNTPQRVPIGAAAFAAELQYQATPKLQETAYLAAYVRNTSELPFLAGVMNVFLDETFVASSRLGTTMPGEKFSLNLGADEGISIKRKIVSRFTEDTGFATRSRRTSYDILVTVTNNKRTPERVVVKDAAPVARDEKIAVRLTAPAERELLKPEEAMAQPPKPGIARDAEGKITWRFDLKPGEKRDLPLKFSIEHPADISVSGVE